MGSTARDGILYRRCAWEVRPAPKENDPKQQLAQLRAAVPQLQQKLQAMHEYAKECEAKAAELEQQNVEMSIGAEAKAAELALKQQENHTKTGPRRSGLHDQLRRAVPVSVPDRATAPCDRPRDARLGICLAHYDHRAQEGHCEGPPDL